MTKKPYGVLIVHGFTSSLDCVNGVEAPIQALGLPTRMPVLRGHGGETPEALRGVAWTDWVADAEAALQDLLTEADKAIVFGHSLGGLVALTLAADHPDVVDSIIVAAGAIQLANPLAPGRPLHFLAPLVTRLIDKVNMPPVYTDPALAQYDTNYAWAPTDAVSTLFDLIKTVRRRLPEIHVPALIMHSRKDTTVAPEASEVIYNNIGTPPDQKRLVWFEVTEHEMFRDCESDATIQTVVDYVRERAGV
ncbi:MAG: lysophospholipase [Chloroflexi bacterium]|nr:lysophospholipase [Chloroflexota bacterium]MBU1750254.1 lysophospholipase [Chloroflexota bacterium]